MNHDEVMRGYCAVLDSCETRPREELYAQHVSMLERLCRHARDTTPFYAERLKPLFDRDDVFRLEAWNDIPFLSRSELRAEFDALKSLQVPENFGGSFVVQTSGSTGQPVRALWTDTQKLASHCVIRRLSQWHHINPSQLMIRLSPTTVSDGKLEKEEDYWGPVFKALDQPGKLVDINPNLPTPHIIARLEHWRPQHLIGRPRELLAIANDYLASGRPPSFQLRSIRTFGETRTSTIDDRLTEVFGVRPFSNYSSEEVGHIALQCPDCANYHVVDEVTHVDVVDDHLRPTPVGAVGRLLATPLYSYAMPLIRYELGDEVRCAAPSCPRSQSVNISEIMGRATDVFHHPEGGMFRPTNAMLTNVAFALDAGAIQMVQQAPTTFLVRYQSKSIPDKETLREAVNQIRQAFGFDASISLEPVSGIPAMASGKRKDFICAIPDC